MGLTGWRLGSVQNNFDADVAAHAFNSTTQEAEVGECL